LIIGKEEFKKKIKSKCFGLTNSTEDKKRIVFLDYDNISFEAVLKDLNIINKDYGVYLTDWFLFKSSSSSYHAINFAKVEADIYLNILESSCCDEDYKTIGIARDKSIKVLRFTPKISAFDNKKVLKESPKLMKFINSVVFYNPYCDYDVLSVSSAHFDFYNFLYGFEDFLSVKMEKDLIDFTNYGDKLSRIVVKSYYSYKG